MNVKRAVAFGAKVVKSPMTAKAVHIARTAADAANLAGLPFSGAIAKGLGVADRVITAIQNKS